MRKVETVGIVIGAPRAGTTWLSRNLEGNPEIFVPPVKEVRHFFGSPNLQRREEMRQRLIRSRSAAADSEGAAGDARLEMEWLEFWASIEDGSSVDAYRRLMTGIPDRKVAIDISPIYCAAGIGPVKRFREAVGDAKIVLLMRNPIDRDISQLSKALHRSSLAGDSAETDEIRASSVEELVEILSRPLYRKRNDYVSAIATWQKVFGNESVHTEFYESITEEPEALLERVTRHLGAKYDGAFYAETLSERYNSFKRQGSRLPTDLRFHLAKLNLPLLRVIAKEIGGNSVHWLADAERLIREGATS